MLIRSDWIPNDPLPAPKAAEIRAVLAGAGCTAADVESFVVAIGGAYHSWATIAKSDAERLTQAERQKYIREIAKQAERLQTLMNEMPEEVMWELQYLLDDDYRIGALTLGVHLEEVAAEFGIFQVAAGRMKLKPPPRKGPAATQHGLHMNLAEAVALELEAIGITPTGSRTGTYEKVLAVLFGRDPHRIALKLLKANSYRSARVLRGYIEDG